MKKIAWITSGFSAHEKDYGGSASIHNLARVLSQSPEVELTIFSLYYPPRRPEYKFYSAKVHSFARTDMPLRTGKLSIWMRCIRAFSKLHTEKKFDIIHAMWAGEPGFVASFISGRHGLPLIVNICGGELAEIPEINYGSRLKFWQKKFVHRSFKQAARIVGGSNYILGKLEKYYPHAAEKWVKIPFGVDENLFQSKFSSRRHLNKPNGHPGFTIINVASAVPVKSHTTLFKAVGLLKAKFPHLCLKVYGRDDVDKLKMLASCLGVKDCVKIMGFREYEKLPEALSEADVFVLSSLYESQNTSVIEAAMCGLPVVSTNVGIAEEITEHLVEPGDYSGLAREIECVLKNLESEKKTALEKVNRVREKFSLSISVKQYVQLYKTL